MPITISRVDGSVKSDLTDEQIDQLWAAIVRNLAPKVLGPNN